MGSQELRTILLVNCPWIVIGGVVTSSKQIKFYKRLKLANIEWVFLATEKALLKDNKTIVNYDHILGLPVNFTQFRWLIQS